MTLAHYSDVLQLAAKFAGLDYAFASPSGLEADEERILRVQINAELSNLWPMAKWPDLIRVQQREYRATYNSLTVYAAGVEVFFTATQKYYCTLVASTGNAPATDSGSGYETNTTYWAESATEYSADDYSATRAYVRGERAYYPDTDKHYQLHAASSTGNAPTDATKWGELIIFDPYISPTQTGETAVGEFIELWPMNPRNTTRQSPLSTVISSNGLQVLGDYPARPWLEFKIVAPSLSGEVFVAADIYTAGAQVQFESESNGVPSIDFYDCLSTTSAGESPSTTAAKWSRVELPAAFTNYLGAKVAANFLVGEDQARFAVADGAAERALQTLFDNLYRNQAQVRRTRVGTY